MDKLDNIEVTKPSAIKFLLWLTVIIHLIANMFGLPIVKFTYVTFVFLLSMLIIARDKKEIIFPFIIFCLFEGQGRVVWGYAAWARIIFDILMAFIILKNGIKSKKFWNLDALPAILNILFVLHFVWFFIELFNPMGAGLLASFATSKFYIFPILLFFFYLDVPFNKNDIFVQRNILAFIFVIISLSIVVIVQDSGKELFMEQMSGHYINLFKKYKIFQDYAYRPWGTSFVPGGMGTLFFCSVGFVLLFNPKTLVTKPLPRIFLSFFKYLCLFFMFYCLFVGEVRSATIKFLGIIAFVGICNFFKSGKKFKKLVGILSIAFLIIFVSKNIGESNILGDLDYENEISRWTELDKEGVASQRSGFWKIIDSVQMKVNFPLGYGPGMTTYFLPAFEAKRSSIIGVPYHYYWNMDNLLMFLMLELGIGAIFYGGALLFIFIASLSQLYFAFKYFSKDDFKDISIASASIFFIIIGNWGAVGIPYNPESFFFWFWVALLFKTINRVKNSSTKQLSEQNNEI